MLRRVAAGAEAGHRHRQVGARGGKVQALADEPGLCGLAASFEAVERPAQGPEIVRVDLRAGQRTAEAEVLAIHRLGFRRTTDPRDDAEMQEGPRGGLLAFIHDAFLLRR